MADLRDHHFGAVIDSIAHVAVEFGQVNVFKGRAVDAPALFGGGGDFHEHLFVRFQFFFGQTVVKRAFDVQNVGRALIFEIYEDRLVHGNAQTALFMQRGDGFVQIFAKRLDEFAFGGKFALLLFAL